MALTKRQFVAHCKLFEGYTNTEAENKWNTDLEAVGDKAKKNKHEEFVLPVELPEEIYRFKERNKKRLREEVDVNTI